MLICPQCQFENPNANKFCQKCGASLSHKVCHQCGTDVPVDALNCHNCGAECGTVWWAILGKEGTGDWGLGTGDWEQRSGGETIPPHPSPISTAPVSSSQFSVGSYLDKEQRYQLLEEISVQNGEVCTRVLDCQPYQISPFEAILTNQQQGLLTPSVEASGIPHLAKAYLALQSANYPEIPQIHDAWLEGDLQVLLIEYRSHWRSLLDLWSAETTSTVQILHWCYQMTQLWALLEPLGFHYSLLDLANLRLDEDQTLVLQRLYVQLPERDLAIALQADENAETPAKLEQPLTLTALGRVWQALFRSSQRTQFGSVVQILDDLEQGNIQTIAQLRSRLEAVATELEITTSPIFEPMEEENTSAPTVLQRDESEDTAGKSDDLPTVVLSVQLSSLEDAGQTDVGRQRQHNEDCFGIETKIEKVDLPKHRILQARGLYILCDGMGGHAGGEVASELAVNTLRQYFQKHWTTNQLPTEDIIREGVYLANQTIFEQNQQDARSGVGRMGTTLVMVLIQGNQAAVANVGDSRCYRVTRKRGLEQITVDHEVGQREIARGVEPDIAYARPDAYQLTQALGPRDETAINPDVEFFEINEDSLFVLVSDGLSDNDLLETHWQNHLLPFLSSGTSLEGGITELIELANQYNGHDNITAILVRAKVRPNVGSRE
ncbi:serine/threonine protein phosphatase [Nostoc sp. PCC 7524]|uniref:serine/threonine phosphatase n=1 Tax=Nostoc sp. (strain ATCC 29411 / PCC 7524) TaxID=28072 RepID=UPI00029EE3CC|nr:serine/threonine phosphatase [Nostoc sp. PCC 7524]AFY50925.1 serine/threonine protein phosphatase [Nostoc sp. PCC 7524]